MPRTIDGPAASVAGPICHRTLPELGPYTAAIRYGAVYFACRTGPSPRGEAGRRLRARKSLERCIRYKGVRYLEVEVHVAGNGRVRRVDVVRIDPVRPAVTACITGVLSMRFMRLGCGWSFRHTWSVFM